ncbi:MAG: FAD-binding oxidoreductase, partial [Acidobacteria bacterium]
MTAISSTLVDALRTIVGPANVRTDAPSLETYGSDALKRGHAADLVVLPDGTDQVAGVVRACAAARVPFVPRGGGTGYTGGA